MDEEPYFCPEDILIGDQVKVLTGCFEEERKKEFLVGKVVDIQLGVEYVLTECSDGTQELIETSDLDCYRFADLITIDGDNHFD